MTELNLQITDIADGVTIIDFFVAQTPFKNWDSLRQLLALRDANENMKSLDVLVEQSVFQNWNNVRQIMAHRDRVAAFVSAAASATKEAQEVNKDAPALPEAEVPASKPRSRRRPNA